MKTLLLPALARALASPHESAPVYVPAAGGGFTVRVANDGPDSQNLPVGGIPSDAISEPAGAAQLLGLMALCLIGRRRPH